MYSRPAERESDPARMVAFMRRWPFATVISTADGRAEATHLPVLVDERADGIVLAAHMARANPHWRSLLDAGEALISFLGPDAYISPAWYEEPLSVPTWDYVAVHARGAVRLLEGTAVLEHAKALVAIHDPAERVRMETLPAEWIEKLAGGIVAFEIAVTSLEGRWKLSQNRTEAEQANVARELEAQGERAREVGAMIRANLAAARAPAG